MSGGAGEAQGSTEVGPVHVVKNDTENMGNKFIPDDDKAAAEAKEEAAAAATAAETLKKQQEDATAIDSTVTDQVDCKGEASLFSPVDPKCIQLKPTPALTALLRAAIANLLANVTSATVEDALDATGNAALIQLATTSAFTPEQLKIMENMSASDNAEMKEAVEKIQSRLSNAVAEGIETARKTVVPPLEKATGEIANGMIVSFLNAVSDIPGVGFVLSALGLIDTAVKAASSAGQIVEKAQEAAEPVTDAIAEVQQTVGKLASEATESVNEAPQSVNEAPPSVNVAPPSVNEAPQSVNEAPQSVNEAPQSVNEAPPSVNVAPPSVAPPSVTPPSVTPPSVTPPNEATVVVPPSEATESVSKAPQSVNVTPPSVNVTPPSVNVAPPSVNVAPPSVNVTPQSVAPRSVPLNHNREIYGPHQNDYPKGDEGYAAFEEARKAFQEDKQKKRDADIAALAIAKQSALPKIEMKTGRGVDAQVFTHENQGITVGQGGSRKRRRIHKLSRRIERTLRRVQKKYGFKDKGDFLRRTLKHHKHKR